MKLISLPTVLPALLLASLPAVAPRAVGVASGERAALTAAGAPALGHLRAGRSEATGTLGASERSELARAQAAQPALGQQRAGDVSLSNRDLTIIGIILLAVLVIAAVA